MARILVIDDNLLVARSFQRVLCDHTVEVETDAPTAVERVTNQEHFNVIICDLWMPRMTGLEVVDAIVALQKRPLFILVSGDEDAVIGARGVDGILMTPFDENAVRALLQALLDLRDRAPTRRLRRMSARSTTDSNT